MFALICIWINDWVNNREAGDLRRYRGHYDVIAMQGQCIDTGFQASYHQSIALNMLNSPFPGKSSSLVVNLKISKTPTFYI